VARLATREGINTEFAEIKNKEATKKSKDNAEELRTLRERRETSKRQRGFRGVE
jgi:hypothetical protein